VKGLMWDEEEGGYIKEGRGGRIFSIWFKKEVLVFETVRLSVRNRRLSGIGSSGYPGSG